MEKPNRPVNASWFGLKDEEGEIVDAELLVDLLETYRFGKDHVPARGFRFKAAATVPAPDNTTEIEEEEDDDGSQGNKSARESTSSVSTDPDSILLETTVSETGSHNETGHNWLESSSTNLPNVENERKQNAEDCEIVVEEEEEETEVVVVEDEEEEEEEGEEKSDRSSLDSEEKSNLETLLAIQESYELYCPSCSSCITRKVILKKRNRRKQVDLSPDLKLNVPVDEPDEPSDIEEVEPPFNVHVLPETRIEDDDQEDKDEGNIFTCLACLKYFIRLGARFLQLDYIRGKPVEEPEVVCDDEPASELYDEPPTDIVGTLIPASYAATEIDQLDPMSPSHLMVADLTQQKQSKPPDDSRENKPVEENLEEMNSINTIQSSPPQIQPTRESFAFELLKSTIYGGLTETITSLGVVSSASASGSSTMNILALAVANLAGGLIVLSQNLQDLRNNSDQEKDRYEELLGRRANFRMHILVAVLSYIFFGLIPPLVYAFSFYETRTKNYKLVSVFSVSLVCVIMLGMSKVYVRKPPNSSPKSYLKSAAYYTSIVVASSGISYVVGDLMGEYIGKLGWFSLDKVSISSTLDVTKPEDYRFISF